MGKCIGCGRPCVTDGQEVWCPPCAIRKINELESRINEFIHDENNPPLAGQFITDAESMRRGHMRTLTWARLSLF